MTGNNLLSHYEKLWQQNFAKLQDPLTDIRQRALQNLLTVGFPNNREENWKYTSLQSFEKNLFQTAAAGRENSSNQLSPFLLNSEHYRIVFLDGVYCNTLSVLPDKVFISKIDSAEVIELPSCQKQSAFVHLNAAFLQEGIFIRIPPNCQLQKVIHLLYINTSQSIDRMSNIRNIILVEPNACVGFLEEHQSTDDQKCMANIVTQIEMKEESVLNYTKLQHQNINSFHFNHMEISQEKNSRCLMNTVHLGAHLSREDIHCFLMGPGSSLQLQGMYLPLRQQHIDLQTFVHHFADYTSSEELIKGVVASKSKAVFNGKIRVEKNVKKAVANLQNKNLLLSRNAEVNTKPELEIYADDVKCKHGATIGQLDQDMFFYLRSRGISEQKARELLLLAFVNIDMKLFFTDSIRQKVVDHINTYCAQFNNE